MNTEAEKRKLRWFMGGLAVIGLLINSFFSGKRAAARFAERTAETVSLRQEQQQQQAQQVAAANAAAAQQAAERTAAAAQQAAERAAAEHASYLAQYVNASSGKRAGVETVALAVASEDGNVNRAVSAALANHFNSPAVEMLPGYFKPSFVSDQLFAGVFAGSAEVVGKLELAKSLDAALLARQSVQYSQNPGLDNILTATMQLEVVLLPVSENGQSQAWTFTASGAGFKQAEARAHAEERLLKQIAADTRMSLAP